MYIEPGLQGAWPPDCCIADCCILRSLTRLTPCSWSSWSGYQRLTGTLDQLPLDELQSVAPTIQQALQNAHGILVNGQCFAHGDAGLPIVWLRQEGQQWRVKFVDFDWANVAGAHCYPPFMSSSIRWPAGATPLAIIQQQHDVALLGAEVQFRLAGGLLPMLQY